MIRKLISILVVLTMLISLFVFLPSTHSEDSAFGNTIYVCGNSKTTKVIFYPTDDTYINESSPGINMGGYVELQTRGQIDDNLNTLIKFDLSTIASIDIKKATLKLNYFTYSNGNPVGRLLYVHRLTSNWDEETVNWNTHPSYVPYPGITDSAIVPDLFGGISWNVTEDVKNYVNGAYNNYGWVIDDTVSNSDATTIFYSKEGTIDNNLKPRLEIETSPDPPTVVLIYPTDGDVLKDTIIIEWYAYDSETSGNLPIYIFLSSDNGQTWDSFTDNPYENTGELSWDTTRYSDGEYKLLIEAVDNDGNVGHDSCNFEIRNNEEPPENNPPNKPSKPSGSKKGKAGDEYTYQTSTVDPDGDQIFYKWDWGDGTDSGWLGPFDSGETVSASHIWEYKDDYTISVKARDTHGDESPWSDPLSISMPKNKPLFINSLIERLLERFPILYQILQRILQL